MEGLSTMITALNIGKSYTVNNIIKEVIGDFSYNFGDFGLYFIVGDSGAGKSTLLNILGLLERPTTGQILYDGRDTTDFSASEKQEFFQRHLSFVFQSDNLIKELTVRENLRLVGASNDAIDRVLEQFEIKDFASSVVRLLSGGEQTRVALARSLLKGSEVILLDEPTGNLDSKNSEYVFKTISKISRTKVVIVVSHDLDAAETYADQILTLKEGKLVKKTDNKTLPFETDMTEKFQPDKRAVDSSLLKYFRKNLMNHKIARLAAIICSLITFVTFCVSLTFTLLNRSSFIAKAVSSMDLEYYQLDYHLPIADDIKTQMDSITDSVDSRKVFHSFYGEPYLKNIVDINYLADEDRDLIRFLPVVTVSESLDYLNTEISVPQTGTFSATDFFIHKLEELTGKTYREGSTFENFPFLGQYRLSRIIVTDYELKMTRNQLSDRFFVFMNNVDFMAQKAQSDITEPFLLNSLEIDNRLAKPQHVELTSGRLVTADSTYKIVAGRLPERADEIAVSIGVLDFSQVLGHLKGQEDQPIISYYKDSENIDENFIPLSNEEKADLLAVNLLGKKSKSEFGYYNKQIFMITGIFLASEDKINDFIVSSDFKQDYIDNLKYFNDLIVDKKTVAELITAGVGGFRRADSRSPYAVAESIFDTIETNKKPIGLIAFVFGILGLTFLGLYCGLTAWASRKDFIIMKSLGVKRRKYSLLFAANSLLMTMIAFVLSLPLDFIFTKWIFSDYPPEISAMISVHPLAVGLTALMTVFLPLGYALTTGYLIDRFDIANNLKEIKE